MATMWEYKSSRGQIMGPVSSRELRQMADSGDIERDTRIRKVTRSSSSGRWLNAGSVRGLFSQPPAAASAPSTSDARPLETDQDEAGDDWILESDQSQLPKLPPRRKSRRKKRKQAISSKTDSPFSELTIQNEAERLNGRPERTFILFQFVSPGTLGCFGTLVVLAVVLLVVVPGTGVRPYHSVEKIGDVHSHVDLGHQKEGLQITLHGVAPEPVKLFITTRLRLAGPMNDEVETVVLTGCRFSGKAKITQNYESTISKGVSDIRTKSIVVDGAVRLPNDDPEDEPIPLDVRWQRGSGLEVNWNSAPLPQSAFDSWF